MTLFTFPLCSSLPHPSTSTSTPISSTTSIIDLSTISFSSIWKLRHHLQEASRLATANYPETLGMVVVVNSPSYFPTIWGWIKVMSLSLSFHSFARRFNMNDENAGLVRRRHPKQDIRSRQGPRSDVMYPHRRTESPQGIWRRA